MANGGSIQRVTTQSWGGRLKNAISGVLVGGVLVAGTCILLFWNEGRAVRRSQALAEGAASVLSVPASNIGIDNEGQLVHVQGEARSDATVEDRELGVSVEGLRLVRSVAMYQWVEEQRSEERQKLGGGTERVTTYTYDTAWREEPVDASRFQQVAGHENPPGVLQGATIDAETVQLGAFLLGDEVASRIGGAQELAVDESVAQRAAGILGREVALESGGLYAGRSASSPVVGDVRIGYQFVPHKAVSVVAQQDGDQLRTYTTSNGGKIVLVEDGSVPAETMFESARRGNTLLTWSLRLVGLVASWIGFGLLLRPLRVFADVVPFVGSLVGVGLGLVAALLAAILSLAVIALGWIIYRPLLGIALLALGVGVAVVLVRKLLRARKAITAKAALGTPEPQELPPLPGQ
jgi:hypothetical protein